MKSLTTNASLNRDGALREIEGRLKDEQRRVETAIIESKKADGHGLEKLWQERDSPAEDEIREVEFIHRASLLFEWRQIEDALERLRRQRFGRCIECGKKIAVKRLVANPIVSRCLACQAGFEGDISTPSL
jgi:RNA polymerase-binding transcription factor DksA